MVICVDFDGTCVTHEFPRIGKDIGAQEVLKKLVKNGHQLILFTMRSNRLKKNKITDPSISNVTGPFLQQAIDWFSNNNIPLYGIQTNPTQINWTTSPKAYGELYIDDAALGCPLIHPLDGSKPYVNWNQIEKLLIDKKLIS